MQPARRAALPSRKRRNRTLSSAGLWFLILAVSPAVEIAFYAVTAAVPKWVVWVRIGTMAAVLVLGRFVRAASAYRNFCCIYGSLLCTGFGMRLIMSHAGTIALLDQSFERRMTVTGMQYLVVVLVALILAWNLCGRSLDAIYLRLGDLRAKLQPAWLQIAGVPVRWRLVAPVFGSVSLLCVTLFLKSEGDSGRFQLRLLLWALVFAANNAFVEEAIYRSALIASMRTDFGLTQAVVASAVIFGLTHWNGIPFGVAGVLLALTFALLAGKAMIETGGMFWPWFMHLLPDVAIYYYWGAGAVKHP